MDLFKLLTKNSFDIISVLDRDGSIKFESDACEKILGYKSGERIGKNAFDYLHPDDKAYVIKEFTDRNKKIKRLEFRFAHKKGNWVWLEAVGQDFIDDPEVKGIIVNSRDITEYKKEQKILTKSQKGYKRLINNSNSLILEIDADNYEILSCNMAMAKHLNQDVKSIIGQNINNVIPSKSLNKKLEYGKNALVQNNTLQFEEEIDDSVYLHRFIPYVDQQKRYIQIISFEITERKKAEKELKESETKYRELFQLLEEGFIRADKNGIITMANNSMALLAGYESSEELIGFSMNKLYAIPSERSKMLTDLKKNGTLRNYEVRLITKAGDIRWTSCSIKFFKDQNNGIAGTEGLVRDITEQKRLEQKVVESQQRFKQFMDHIPGAAFLKDRENNLLYCNEKYAAQLGTTPKKLIQGNALENVPKHLQKKYQEENQDIIEKGNMILSESEFSSKKGSEHWLTYKFPVSIQKETFIGAISIDITDRKKVEEALKESEEKYRIITENASDVIWILNLNKKAFSYISPSVFALRGYTPEEAMEQDINQSLTPESAKKVTNTIEQILPQFLENPEEISKKTYRHELRQTCKDGSIIWIETTTKYQFNRNNEVEVLGISRNIDERKNVEEALKDSEENFKSIVENSTNTFYKHDINHKLTYISPQIKDLLGYEVEEAKRKWTDFLTDNPINEIGYRKTVKAIETGKIQEVFDLESKHKDGNKVWVEVRETPVVRNGNTIEIVGALTDVTEQRKFEKQLKESKEQYQLLAENVSDIIIQLDGNFGIVYLSPSVKQVTGYSVKELGAGDIFRFVFKEDLNRLQKEMKLCIKNKEPHRVVEYRILTKQGHIRWVGASSTYIYTEQGDFDGMITVARDITDRKQAEEAMKESEEKFRLVFENTSPALLIIGYDTKILMVNSAFCNMTNYAKEEIIGTSWENIIPPKELDRMKEYNKLRISSSKNVPDNYEFTFYTKHGGIKHGLISISNIPKRGEIIASFIDITEQKQAEQALKESEEKFKTIFKMSLAMICIADIKTATFKVINPAFTQILGYAEEELLSKPFLSFIHPDDKESTIQILEKDLKAGKYVIHFENRYRCKDNSYRWIEWNSYPIVEKGITYAIGNDITDRKMAERKLIKSQDSLSYLNQSLSRVINIESIDRIYQYMADAVHLLYPNSIALYISLDEKNKDTVTKAIAGLEKTDMEQIQRILGFKIIGQHYKLQEKYRKIFQSGKLELHQDGFASFVKGLFSSLAAKSAQKVLNISKVYTIGINWESDLLGAMVIFTLNKTEISESLFIENYIAHMAAVIRNKGINDQLQKSEAQYRELNATKDKFFSIISHDLKGPFNSILGFSKLITKKVRNQEYQKVNEFSEFINKSAQKSYDLLDNLLQWSRIQTGRMEFNPETIKLKEMVDAACILLSPNYKAKDIQVTNLVSEDLQVKADQFMLDTVIRNLLSNAIKFTYPKGKITIQAKQESKETTIEVKDNGVGINPKDIKRLFKIENTNSSEGTHEEKGTGLGLVLCKEFVEKHGGEIWVQSKEGEGSNFIFNLPQIAEH